MLRIPRVNEQVMNLKDIEKLFNERRFKRTMESNIAHVLRRTGKRTSFSLTTKTSDIYTDGKRIVVGLPEEYVGMKYGEIYSMVKACVGHESAHVKWSNFNSIKPYLQEVAKRNVSTSLGHSMFNIIEDGRIERLLCEELPGYAKHIKFLNLKLIKKDGKLNDTRNVLGNIIGVIHFLAVLGVYPTNYKQLLEKKEIDLIESKIHPLVLKGVMTNSYSVAQQVCLEIIDLLKAYIPEQKSMPQELMDLLEALAQESYQSSEGKDGDDDEDLDNTISSMMQSRRSSKSSGKGSSSSSQKQKNQEKEKSEESDDDSNKESSKGSTGSSSEESKSQDEENSQNQTGSASTENDENEGQGENSDMDNSSQSSNGENSKEGDENSIGKSESEDESLEGESSSVGNESEDNSEEEGSSEQNIDESSKDNESENESNDKSSKSSKSSKGEDGEENEDEDNDNESNDSSSLGDDKSNKDSSEEKSSNGSDSKEDNDSESADSSSGEGSNDEEEQENGDTDSSSAGDSSDEEANEDAESESDSKSSSKSNEKSSGDDETEGDNESLNNEDDGEGNQNEEGETSDNEEGAENGESESSSSEQDGEGAEDGENGDDEEKDSDGVDKIPDELKEDENSSNGSKSDSDSDSSDELSDNDSEASDNENNSDMKDDFAKPLPNHFEQPSVDEDSLSYEEEEKDFFENLQEEIEEEAQRAFEKIEKEEQRAKADELNAFHEGINVDEINSNYSTNRQEPNFRFTYPDYPVSKPQPEFKMKIHGLKKTFEKMLKNDETHYKGQKRGRLDTARLWRLGINDDSVFKKKNVVDRTDYAVEILFDVSGSMHRQVKYKNAVGTAICIESALMDLEGVEVKTVAFNFTSGTKMRVLKDFKDKESKTPSVYHADITGGCNRDGFAIRVALNELKKHRAKNKLLIVISDGMPSSDMERTEDALADVKNAVHEGRKDATIVSILINDGPIGSSTRDVFHYMYEDKGSIMVDVVHNPEDLMKNIVLYLKRMFRK